jgi:putative glutamine amidotransferase
MISEPNITRSWKVILWAAVLILHACGTRNDEPVTIALSKGSPVYSYKNYYNWIQHHDSTVIILDMYSIPIDSALQVFSSCSGLILTGGTDIFPGIYNKLQDTSRCWEPDHKRDSLELALFQAARKAGKPILGICRGEQMINVALGGSLVVDIPSDWDTAIEHQCEDYQSCYHKVTVESRSLLHEISGIYAAEVNSNHHQGVDVLARELKSVSYASDGLIEAVEWAYPEGNPFLLGVQWHPERMEPDHPLSGPIAERFLEEAASYSSRISEKLNQD